MRLILIVLIGLTLPTLCYASHIFVPDDYPTIQEAIDAANKYDVIFVAPGTYEERIDFLGKEISVQSEEGPYVTMIRGPVDGPVVTCNTGETMDSILDGFTITSSAVESIGVLCAEASPRIFNNIIRDHQNPYEGAGVLCYKSGAIIGSNRIEGNKAPKGAGMICIQCPSQLVIAYNKIRNNEAELGGGIRCIANSSPVILNNVIEGNSSPMGGGIYCISECSPTIVNNTIVNNHTEVGVVAFINSNPTITNSILWNNGADEVRYMGDPISVSYSNVKGGYPGTGNLNQDPGFVDPAEGDFHLTYTSPCKNAGNHDLPHAPPFDFEGDPRNPSDPIDMGADEFYPRLYAMDPFSPGEGAVIKVIDIPRLQPVALWAGSGLMESPLPTLYGDWFLEFPLIYETTLPAIPADGVARFPVRIPSHMAVPGTIPVQAFAGDHLTNPFLIHIH